MKVLAIIPARSGSKSVKDKNIRLIDGKPMLAYSIDHAVKSRYINRVVLSTDSEKYAEIGKKYGADVPFLRPSEISTDSSLDIEAFEHALKYFKENENYEPQIVVQLRPTYPIRNVSDIDNMIELLIKNADADSVRCIAPAKEIAYKMWRYGENGYISPILQDIPEAYNLPRQELPEIYYQNACVDVTRYETIIEKHSMTGNKIIGYILNHNFDIDTEDDFQRASKYLQLRRCFEGETSKKFVFDIDGVIAKFNKSLKYDESLPNIEVIRIVNALFKAGNEIVLHTARGYKTRIDWKDVTEKQLADWGVLYHRLIMGKPDADFYIDDKMMNMADLIECYANRCF